MYIEETKEIVKIINKYFQGLFEGKTDLLKEVFHPESFLFGEINGELFKKSSPDFIESLKERKSPQEEGEEFNMKILSLEILNDVAVAKLHVPMLGFNYYDFMSLNKIDGKWIIVNKLFTNN